MPQDLKLFAFVLDPAEQVPALRAGAVSATRPRQAGMVIGVVPRYDPQGMGLPMLPPSTPEVERRPRAATLDGESSREVTSYGYHRASLT